MANSWVEGPEPKSVVDYGTHPDQIIEFFGNSGQLVALIHGGYWRSKHNREHMRALASKIAESGFRSANIEYRREPFKPALTMDDIDSSLKYLESNLERPTALIGFSVGGQLALINSGSIHKLILLAPVTDLNRTKNENLGEGAVTDFFGETELAEFDPMQKNYDQHIFVIHGDSDSRVPISHSRDFVKVKGGKLMELYGADHFDVINPDGLAFELIIKALA